jgi:hypothetical protein
VSTVLLWIIVLPLHAVPLCSSWLNVLRNPYLVAAVTAGPGAAYMLV